MTIAAAAIGRPIPKPNGAVPFTDGNGQLTIHGIELLNKWHSQHVGMGRIIPCSASGTNLITLTPNDATPLLEKYVFGDVFMFVAENTSTGAVTGTVTPKTGTLDTLKVYASDGAAQAGVGDVVAGSTYMWIYDPALDTAAGGFVLK